MRVLHVAESAKGGVGSYLANAGRYQARALGCSNLRFLVPAEHQSQLIGVEAGCIRGYERPDRSAASLRRLALALTDEVAKFDPHVIHLHSTFAGLVARPIFGLLKSRPALIYCPHGWAFNVKTASWRRKVLEFAERALAPLCDSIVAISQFEALEAFRVGIERSKVTLIPNGVPDLDAATTVPASWIDRRLKVLFVGRLDRQKGVDLLSTAVSSLEREVCLRVVGEQVAGCENLGLPPNAQMLGWLDPTSIAAQMAACDVVVIPSRWEGFGLVAIEAMRAGKPVVAARVGGLPEVVGEEVGGRLIDPESSLAIRQALLSMDVPTRRRLGTQGRARFEARFTAKKMSKALMALYDNICDRRRLAGTRAPALPRRSLLGPSISPPETATSSHMAQEAGERYPG